MKKKDYENMNTNNFKKMQDTAYTALQDGVIEKYTISMDSGYGNAAMVIHYDGKFTEYDESSWDSFDKFMDGLYQQEFVINLEDDLKRIIDKAEIHLLNGNIIEVSKPYTEENNTRGCLSLRFTSIFGTIDGYGLLELKGATVKQSRK